MILIEEQGNKYKERQERMKLFHVDPQIYGTHGSVAVADSKEIVEGLFLEKYPYYKEFKGTTTLLTENLYNEYVSSEFLC